MTETVHDDASWPTAKAPGARVVKAAGEDSAEARERLRLEREHLAPSEWTWDHWRSRGQDARTAQGLAPDVDPAVLREAGRLAAPYLT